MSNPKYLILTLISVITLLLSGYSFGSSETSANELISSMSHHESIEQLVLVGIQKKIDLSDSVAIDEISALWQQLEEHKQLNKQLKWKKENAVYAFYDQISRQGLSRVTIGYSRNALKSVPENTFSINVLNGEYNKEELGTDEKLIDQRISQLIDAIVKLPKAPRAVIERYNLNWTGSIIDSQLLVKY